ncbi:MAG: NAD(P)-dependent glycerol-3-phosphate dehydrogenase [Dehalococcoidia bacterium]|nr:NAD(P)-dependent glycerol-3-phosphate dehydrogenase [Dehalococcoidia bacterium]
MTTVSIIGATTWGNTLASLIAANSIPVRVWANKKERADRLQQMQSGGIIEFTHDADLTASQCDMAIFAVPAQSLRKTARIFGGRLNGSTMLVSAAKGLEAATGKRMTEILEEEIRPDGQDRLAVVSGPNLSKEISQGLPAVTIIACTGDTNARKVTQLLSSGSFSAYISDDVKGVEICGALKNVIALGAGMVDGLKLGSNAKAALVTVGWQEVTLLGEHLGARERTFYGFAGLGDLVTTCISPLSRNYHVGYQLAGGKSLADVLAGMSNVVEGVDTAAATHLLCGKLRLELPLMEAIYKVLCGQMPASGIAGYFLNGHKSG